MGQKMQFLQLYGHFPGILQIKFFKSWSEIEIILRLKLLYSVIHVDISGVSAEALDDDQEIDQHPSRQMTYLLYTSCKSGNRRTRELSYENERKKTNLTRQAI